MSYQSTIAFSLHQLGTLIWVGGMLFAQAVLSPALKRFLEPLERPPVMLAVFQRFFVLVWLSVVLLWASGLWLFLGLYGGTAGAHVHAMVALAAVMTAVFAYIWFVPYRRLQTALAAGEPAAAGAALARIRVLILVNLLLGLVTALLGSSGPALLAAMAASAAVSP
jgi:uncharacterized membrane protein